MREYTNYPKNIENNNNISTEVKKPKLYLVTSKIVNLFAIFVASISVSTFFATRYIGIGDIFFSANVFSTMLSVAIFIVILEIYGRKNALKAFMAGAYAILLVFFISAFITDFNPTPLGYYQSSFINFHQTVLLSVFISYVLSFLVCIKVYLYMKDDLDLSYLWIKSVPTIIASQIIYTICYYIIYHGFNNLDVVALAVKNELYLKFFMMIISVLIIYFIVSGIKSGFFDIFKNVFASKNIRYIDTYEHNPIKSIYDSKEELPYDSHPMSLGDYRSHRPEEPRASHRDDHREDSPRRSRRLLPDYSEGNNLRDSKIDYSRDNYPSLPESYNNFSEEVPIQKLRKSRRSLESNDSKQEISSNRSSNRRTNKKALRGNSRINSVKRSNTNQETFENFQEEGIVSNNNISRNRNQTNRSNTNLRANFSASRPTSGMPKIVGINRPNNTNGNSFGVQQQNTQMAGQPTPNQMGKQNFSFGNNSQLANKTNFAKPNPLMKNQSNPFGNNKNLGNNSNSFGNKFGQQNQQPFFANKLTPNNKPAMGNSGVFGNINKSNTWNKR